MEVLSILALIMLTLVGYSAGAALVAQARLPQPLVADLVIIVAVWAAALALRPTLGRWQGCYQARRSVAPAH